MKKICSLLAILMIFLLIGDIFISKETSADTIYPQIKVTSSQKTITTDKDKEFVIDYTFTPEPIPVTALNSSVDKEIILVIDISGSMDERLQNSYTTKIEALIRAAKAFVNKFSNEDKTKIGIVAYSTKGKVTQELTDARETAKLGQKIDSLKNVTGATNIGEGMRQAIKELNNNTAAKKYVILMSDGEPTAFSYSGKHDEERYDVGTGAYYLPEYKDKKLSKGSSLFTSLTDSSDMKTGYYTGTNDPNSYAKNFGKEMAVIGKGKGIRSFAVGFTLQGSGADKLREIATAGDGIYYNGNNESEIINIYEEIATKIIGEYIMVNNTVTYSSLANLTYVGTEYQPNVQGNEITLKLPDIKYTLNSSKTQYTAEPFTINLKFKASNYGDYSLGAANLVFNYFDIEKKIKKLELPVVKINVPSPVDILNLSRTIENSTDNNLPINSNFNMLYTITPSPITPDKVEKKEIVLVIDTSSSMKDRNNTRETKNKIEIVKEQAIALVKRFAGNPNVKFGIVTHGKKGEAKVIRDGKYLVGADSSADIINSINSLTTYDNNHNNNGNNIGDAIRRALWMFSYDNDAGSDVDKSIIMITDGGNSYYSYTGFYTNLYKTIDNNDVSYRESYGILVSEDSYHTTMAGIIASREGSKKINAYYMLLTSDDSKALGLLKSMKDKSGGEVYDLNGKSETEVISAFNTIAGKFGGGSFKITAPKLKVTSKSGFNLASTTSEYTFKDVEYTFNPRSGKYEAPTQTIPVGYKAMVIGNDGITLSGDSFLSYKDLRGSEVSSIFPDMLIRVRDNTQIKLGIFSSTSIPGKPIGENYLNTEYVVPEFAENSPIRMAAMVKNYGEGSRLQLIFNKDMSRGIGKVNLTQNDVFVYRIVNDKLEKVIINTGDIIISGNGTNNIVLDINIPAGTPSTENYYIVNYNFSSTISEAEELQQEEKILKVYGEVIGSGKKDSFSITPVFLPDVF